MPAIPDIIPHSRTRTLVTTAVYLLMLAATVAAFLLIREQGETLTASATTVATASISTAPPRATNDALFHVLLALAAVVITGRLLGVLFTRLGQPPVIGEVISGIVLGPSLLGRIAPDASAYLLPQSVAPHLGMIAQLGVILYMFTVGLELDTSHLRHRGHSALAISHASIIAPFLLGALLALGIYPTLSSGDVPFTVFALFLGVAMSVTAFPVLARILTDRKMSHTPLGVVALTCAAIDDVTAWCLLALVVGVAQASIGSAVQVLALTLGYVALMFLVVRPAIARFAPRFENGPPSQSWMAALFVGLLISSLMTELIGIHAIFGAFLAGAVIPHDSPAARELIRKLEDIVATLLLPAFFAFTGMRTQIGLVTGVDQWLICGLIIAVATLGKFGGTLAAARLTGLGWRESSALGILMNTRGLMELIVLNVGLDLGVISPTVFAMMVLMALVTTLATTPILRLLKS